jgi:chromosome partitioning protein
MRTNTTLVINPKGGSGKTTVATNLAAYFAAKGVVATILDYDPQASSLAWLQLRKPSYPRIYGANGAPQRGLRLRGIEMHVPAETRQCFIDAPAGASGLLLQEMLARADSILIPVAPSAIDIHATANFIRDLLLAGRIRARSIRLGVLANRVRNSMHAYPPLERFLGVLNLPLVGRIEDSDAYVKAAEGGIGVFEMDPAASQAEREQLQPVAEWVERAQQPQAPRPEDKIIPLRPRTQGAISAFMK